MFIFLLLRLVFSLGWLLLELGTCMLQIKGDKSGSYISSCSFPLTLQSTTDDQLHNEAPPPLLPDNGFGWSNSVLTLICCASDLRSTGWNSNANLSELAIVVPMQSKHQHTSATSLIVRIYQLSLVKVHWRRLSMVTHSPLWGKSPRNFKPED